jgi:hypothetical protein
MELGFAHRAFQAQQQTIVEQRRVVDAIIVADQCVGDAAEFQQAIPVGVVAGQARDLEAQNDSHVGQRHFAGQRSEAGALVGTGAGQPEVFIDDDHLLSGPTQLAGFVGQGVLASCGFPVMLHLGWRGLANVNESGSLCVGRFDLGGILPFDGVMGARLRSRPADAGNPNS